MHTRSCRRYTALPRRAVRHDTTRHDIAHSTQAPHALQRSAAVGSYLKTCERYSLARSFVSVLRPACCDCDPLLITRVNPNAPLLPLSFDFFLLVCNSLGTKKRRHSFTVHLLRTHASIRASVFGYTSTSSHIRTYRRVRHAWRAHRHNLVRSEMYSL